jgi:hypothetical protein
MNVKVKVKMGHSITCRRRHRTLRDVITLLILNLYTPTVFLPGKSPCAHCTVGWGALREMDKKNISCPSPGFES